MAKNAKKKGRSVKNGNSPSPYTKYQKSPFQYDKEYHSNYLVNGILFRNGRPYHHRTINSKNVPMAAE